MIPQLQHNTLEWSRYSLELESRTLVMGVLNVTPDSFYNGGRYHKWDHAIAQAHRMAKEGADIIDVGGESTRPYSEPLSAEQELERVLPVVETLSKELDLPISIDTYKSEVALKTLDAGAAMVNDISAMRFDPDMGRVVAAAGVPIVLMHMKGTPRDMQVNPTYDDLLGDIMEFLRGAADKAISMGIKRNLIIIDPGIGFGKSFDDNLLILRELEQLSSLGYPVLVGTSNKSFIGRVLDLPVESRETGTMATIAAAVMNGAHIIRAHNVRAAKETVTVIDAIKSGASAPFS
ncbi:MAG: dihydropteroate synthase [Thermodesulfobacteriota bacterium]